MRRTLVLLVLAGLSLTITALVTAPQLAGPAMLATMAAAVGFLGLQVAFDRREEIAADLFAIDLTRDLDAASELMLFYENSLARPLPARGLGRAWALLLAPSAAALLAAVTFREELVRFLGLI